MVSQKKHSPEQIINKLRQAEVELARGATGVVEWHSRPQLVCSFPVFSYDRIGCALVVAHRCIQ